MSDNIKTNELIQDLQRSNKKYVSENQSRLQKYINIQEPKIALLTCSDSRVIPEYIFSKSIGDIFVVRVAGNVAIDSSVISSLEYAVEHLKVDILIILGHTNCGAVHVAEESKEDNCGPLIDEIRQSFSLHNDHILSNVMRQLDMLPKRSSVISKAINEEKLHFIGAVYHLEDGSVEFL